VSLRQFEHSSDGFSSNQVFQSGRGDAFGLKPDGGEDRERSENQQRQNLCGHEWRLRLGRSQFLSRGRSQEFHERVGRFF